MPGMTGAAAIGSGGGGAAPAAGQSQESGGMSGEEKGKIASGAIGGITGIVDAGLKADAASKTNDAEKAKTMLSMKMPPPEKPRRPVPPAQATLSAARDAPKSVAEIDVSRKDRSAKGGPKHRGSEHVGNERPGNNEKAEVLAARGKKAEAHQATLEAQGKTAGV